MILLDTNVISEPLRRIPDPKVIAWIDSQPLETLYLSAITVAELRAGVAMLPSGKRRDGLAESIEEEVLPLFAQRILPFDKDCTEAYAILVNGARRAGVPIGAADAFIGATALSNGFTVASRDLSPFKAGGLPTINPWQ